MNISRFSIDTISAKEKKELDQILNTSLEGTIFQTIDWNKILFETFNKKHLVFVARNGQDPVGYFISTESSGSGPRTHYSSPDRSLETVYGGPIVISGVTSTDSIKKELVEHLYSEYRAARIEIWLQPDVKPDYLEQIAYTVTPYYTSIINLEQNEDDLWQNIHKKARKRIRHAAKSGVQIVKEGRPYLPKYYEMVTETLRARGLTPLPKEFYQRVMDSLEPKNMAKLFIALYDEKVICGRIFLLCKDTVYNWHEGSFKEYRPLSPNDLIMWESLKYFRQNGYKKYDLVSIESDRLPGIAAFKMKFGGETTTYYRAIYKTPFFRLPVLAYYIKHPLYLFSVIRRRISCLKGSN